MVSDKLHGPDKKESELPSPLDPIPSRRKFFQSAATVVAGVVTLAATGTSVSKPQSVQKKKLGMVIDLERCVVCRACVVACKQENKTPPGMSYNPVLEEETGEYPHVKLQWFPRPCQHCDKPVCLEVCPYKAIKKREDGIVFIDPNVCRGTKACVKACPYKVPIFDEGEKYHEGTGVWNEVASPEMGLMEKPGKRVWVGKARKCTFCVHKQDKNGDYIDLPACVKTCMGKAIHFGDLGDPNGKCLAHGEGLQELLKTRKHMRLKEEEGTGPNVYYLT
ncbi:MAG: 4Fe-4S dicluster domain-containing protein [Gammaproteobacteria bacterium]|nr:4Fe-4S dicluster domain-containing protein [Gammaproteobacteria bacterium]